MKTLLALATVSVLALAVLGVSTPASAGGNGGAIAAGVVGGLTVGAIIGSQGNRGYYNGPSYVEPAYVSEPQYLGACHIERQDVTDAYGNYRTRRVRVCD